MLTDKARRVLERAGAAFGIAGYAAVPVVQWLSPDRPLPGAGQAVRVLLLVVVAAVAAGGFARVWRGRGRASRWVAAFLVAFPVAAAALAAAVPAVAMPSAWWYLPLAGLAASGTGLLLSGRTVRSAEAFPRVPAE